MKRVATCVVMAIAAVGFASADATWIGEFTGDYSDGFETQQRFQFLPHYDVFQGNGDIWQLGSGQGLHITSGWGYYYTVYPHSGEVFMGPTSGVGVEWEFDVPAAKFGGWFATNYQSPGATAYFYDENGDLIDTEAVQSPLGQWAWDGWEIDPPAKTIQIWSDHNAGHIMQDDVQYTPIPEPATLSLLALGALGLLRRR